MSEEASEADALLGTTIADRWRLTRKLGEGGMGAVFAGASADGAECAVKILHKEFVREEQVVSRFYAEAEASRRLNHPNIARVFESGQTPQGNPFLLMELLKGKSLGDACPEGTKLPIPDAVRIIKAVLDALKEAHRQEIVHRDLKPDNIFLVTAPDGSQQVKLLDFGIARVVDAAGGHMRKTRTGMLLGTPGYMSPEQLRNSKTVDPRGDLWSLATVFYEIIAGHDPYGETNDFARLTAVFSKEAFPIDRDDPSLAPWRPFFQKCFQKDIANRFQSATEMAEAIDAIAQGRPMPEPVSLGATQPVPAAIAQAAVQAAQAPAAVQPQPAPQPAPPQPAPIQPVPAPQAAPPGGKTSPALIGLLVFAILAVLAGVGFLAHSLAGAAVGPKPQPSAAVSARPTATPTPAPPIKRK